MIARVSAVLLPMLIKHLNQSWSAVARGAAIRGLKLSRAFPFPDSTIAKENFGVVTTDGTTVRLLSEVRFAAQASSPVLTRRGCTASFNTPPSGKHVRKKTDTRALTQGEYMTDGMLKVVAIPWQVIESGHGRGDGTIRLSVCHLVDPQQALRTIVWRPKRSVEPNDVVALEMRLQPGNLSPEWAFYHNKVRYSGHPWVSDEGASS